MKKYVTTNDISFAKGYERNVTIVLENFRFNILKRKPLKRYLFNCSSEQQSA